MEKPWRGFRLVLAANEVVELIPTEPERAAPDRADTARLCWLCHTHTPAPARAIPPASVDPPPRFPIECTIVRSIPRVHAGPHTARVPGGRSARDPAAQKGELSDGRREIRRRL